VSLLFKDDIESSLDYLSSIITANVTDTKTHRSIIINGISNDQKTIDAIAVYMVALIANAIEANLQVRCDLLGTDDEAKIELQETVIDYIGENNNQNRDFIEDERNPWISEALIHLLLNVSRSVGTIHPPGKIIAVGLVHDDPKDKGIDITALYDGITIGLTVGEGKAHKLYPDQAISKATNFYVGFDVNRVLGKRIRTQVQIMRASLPDDLSSRATEGFWKKERCFMPVLIYDQSVARDWSKPRRVMNKLDVPIDRRILIPLEVCDYDEFFDKICDSMRQYVERVNLSV
jgi:hypothetical protein